MDSLRGAGKILITLLSDSPILEIRKLRCVSKVIQSVSTPERHKCIYECHVFLCWPGTTFQINEFKYCHGHLSTKLVPSHARSHGNGACWKGNLGETLRLSTAIDTQLLCQWSCDRPRPEDANSAESQWFRDNKREGGCFQRTGRRRGSGEGGWKQRRYGQ